MLDADIEGEAVFRQQAQSREEIRLKAEGGVALGFDQPPDAADVAQFLQRQNIGLDGQTLFQRRMGNDAAQARIAVGQFLDEARFAEMQAGINRHFGKDQLVDDNRTPRLVEILKPITPVDLRHIGEPTVAEPRHVIEMDMGVNDWKFWHFSFPVMLNCVLWSCPP